MCRGEDGGSAVAVSSDDARGRACERARDASAFLPHRCSVESTPWTAAPASSYRSGRQAVAQGMTRTSAPVTVRCSVSQNWDLVLFYVADTLGLSIIEEGARTVLRRAVGVYQQLRHDPSDLYIKCD